MKKNITHIDESLIINTIYFENMKNQLLCTICLNLLNSPSMCSNCETAFCSDCINSWLNRNELCPMRCPKNSVVTAINKTKKSILDGLKLRCKYGCEVPLNSFQSHSIQCDEIHKNFIKCWNCDQIADKTKFKQEKQEKQDNKVFDLIRKLEDSENINEQALYRNLEFTNESKKNMSAIKQLKEKNEELRSINELIIQKNSMMLKDNSKDKAMIIDLNAKIERLEKSLSELKFETGVSKLKFESMSETKIVDKEKIEKVDKPKQIGRASCRERV